ncbi:MAG: hypothetical protein BRC24_01575, partial [Parcubacteria group bacterium SW_4_46_8]
MPRSASLTNGKVTFSEVVKDQNGDNIFLKSVVLSEINGSLNSGKQVPTWLDWNGNKQVKNDGSVELTVDLLLEESALNDGDTYTFELNGSDGKKEATRTVNLTVLSEFFNTASYDGKSFNIESETSSQSVGGIYVKQPGDSFYVANGRDTIHRYNLTESWNLSSASYTGDSYSVSSQINYATDLFFKPDGTTMFVLGGGVTEYVYQYNLSTPWDITSASYSNKSLNISGEDNNPNGMYIKEEEGDRFFIIGRGDDSVWSYSMSSAWDIGSGSYDNIKFDVSRPSRYENGYPTDIFVKPGGEKFFVMFAAGEDILSYDLSSPWDVTSASYTGKQFSVTSEDVFP